MVVDLDDVDTKMKSSTWRQREVLNMEAERSPQHGGREKSSFLEAEKSSTVTWVEASRF